MNNEPSPLAARRLSACSLILALAGTLGPFAQPAEAGYMLPWATCTWRIVLQGWNGSYSHTGTMRYAYDFDHWEGQSVYAARHGTVQWEEGDWPADHYCSTSACANEANYVVIDHSDGKATLYLHLKNVSVSKGQTVQRGQRIGAAGKTGWTSGNAHLHYQRQNQGAWFTQSISGYFDEYANTQLQQGSWYLSSNTAAGDTDCYPWAQPPPAKPDREIVSPHRSITLDREMVDLLAASPLVSFRGGEALGLAFTAAANVETRLHRVDTVDREWPEYLPTWNLHFLVALTSRKSLPLDTQIEGYPEQDDLWSLLRSKERSGSMERVERLGKRHTTGGEVTLWRWENVAGSFVSAARVDPAGIVMMHANAEALGGAASVTAQDLLIESLLLPQLSRLTWSQVPEVP